jgi:thymidylate kinase
MIAELVDAVVPEPVLVFGSLPPKGRDLDLLVRPAAEEAIVAGFGREHLVRRGREWARFHACSVDAAEVVPAAAWGLPAPEVDALFAEARPIHSYARLVRPAPHHALLILARRLARSGGGLDERRRRRLEQALAEDGDAWERARASAPGWAAVRALDALERVHRGGDPPLRVRLRRWRAELTRRRRGRVVSLSGVDGSGKTSQALALVGTLERLGYEAVTEWTRLSYNPSLDVIAFPVKALVRLVRRRPGRGAREDPAADPAKELRRQSALVSHAWALIVALANASSQRRVTRRHLRRGRIVVCDRYSLDSAVHLRYRYGEKRGFRLQALVVRLLSPRPLRSFFLDVPAPIALGRKPEQYDLDQLARQVRLYSEEHKVLGARRLDGERPRDELCAEIATDVWLALR